MARPMTVTAIWDDEANVWVASSEDVYGLNVEAETLEQLSVRVAGAVQDLLEINGPRPTGPVPVTIHADKTIQVTVAA
ncbi:DUF1902 domain-containing protein [Tabrizicola sp. M-4]|uniref:DUF1902 domain-containing protein n=1 Tax=Tabrizicola sp. M-4 TaxID=3055847 RepID=UPI003DA90AF8